MRQLQENLVNEYTMICNHHRDLQVLQVSAEDFCKLGSDQSCVTR